MKYESARALPIACKATADSYNLQQMFTYVRLATYCCGLTYCGAQYNTNGMHPQIFDDVLHIEFGLLSGAHGLGDEKDDGNKRQWSLSPAIAGVRPVLPALLHRTPQLLILLHTRVVGERAFDAFVFPYGVLVCWGVSESEIAALEDELMEFEVLAASTPEAQAVQVKSLEEDAYGEEFDFRNFP